MARKSKASEQVSITMPGDLSDVTIRRTPNGPGATLLVMGRHQNDAGEPVPDGFNGGFSMYVTSRHLVRWLASLWGNYTYDSDPDRRPYRVELTLRIIDPRDDDIWPGTTNP